MSETLEKQGPQGAAAPEGDVPAARTQDDPTGRVCR